jgi:hypothetical protein
MMASKKNADDLDDVWAPVAPDDQPPPLPVREHFDSLDSDSSDVSGRLFTLARSLTEKKYHPVMLFGTAASDKSSMLASLFHYLQNDPRSAAICMLGEWIIPVDTDLGATVADQVSRFFNHSVMKFNSGVALPRNKADIPPFFIPVILRPNNGKPEIRLAFLESAGEHYRIKEDTADYFPKLKNEILDVYQNFRGALSILVVAPYTLRDAYTAQEIEQPDDSELQAVDQALFGALQSYQSNRRWFDLDHHMFVLTKWDVYAGGISDPEFTNPPVGLVEKIIKERYRLAWNFFQTMPKHGNSNSMQYSSGLISGESVVSVPDKLKPSINKFPRALWNWIYHNASGGTWLYSPQNRPKPDGFFSWLKKALS